MRAAAMLGAALGLTAALGSAATAPAAPPPAEVRTVARQTATPVLVDCFWHKQVKPTRFILACGDGNSRLASLHWQKWGSTRAVARGVNWVNDCDPYCAAGTFHAYPVVVRLDRPQPWKKDPGVQRYGRITLIYPDDRPEQFKRVMTYRLWD